MKYGFHEDGFTAGLRAVLDYSRLPGVECPFDVTEKLPAPMETVFAARVFEGLERSGVKKAAAYVGGGVLWALRTMFAVEVQSERRGKAE
jgi:hypothetical protein